MGITNKHDKKKFLLLSKFKSNGGLKQILSNEKLENLDEQSKLNSMKEKMLSMIDNSVNVNDDDNNNDGKTRSGDEQEIDEDDLDDEFEDEDDDDYNAEKYFDDGDDDDGGDDGGDDEAAF
ncbi:DNA-directed RNA polymerase III subunit Rpc31 [Chlamydia trachomatis]|nr:DNA-directed RNA polymerase III subunit Rpc31 [Chlamydia trachomatis]